MSIFNLPDLGEGLDEAEIREWYVKVGDSVTVDQPLVSVETAKALVDVPSPREGVVTKLYGNPGDFIKTHAPLIEFAGGEDQGSVVGRLEQTAQILDESTMIIGSANKSSTTLKATPQVRALAKELHVDLAQVKSTGPGGQITAQDVKAFAAHHGHTETLHGVRHFMSAAMQRAHAEVVPVTIMDDADITDLSKDDDWTLTLISAILAGIKAEPELNAWYDGKTFSRTLHDEVNLGIAMDNKEGLFVPVLKNVGASDEASVRAQIEKYKKDAAARSLSLQDLQGATITLSNFGMFAGRYATVMIMPPMVSIVGCGRIREVVLPYQGKIAIRRIAPLSLSFDHRAITGGEASRFLSAMIAHLEGKR